MSHPIVRQDQFTDINIRRQDHKSRQQLYRLILLREMNGEMEDNNNDSLIIILNDNGKYINANNLNSDGTDGDGDDDSKKNHHDRHRHRCQYKKIIKF